MASRHRHHANSETVTDLMGRWTSVGGIERLEPSVPSYRPPSYLIESHKQSLRAQWQTESTIRFYPERF
jgi:hypothetical protein